MKLKTLIKKLKTLQAEYGGNLKVLSGDDHDPLSFAETYYRDGTAWIQFKVDDPEITDYDLMSTDEAINHWVCSNIKLIPEGTPETLDFWEVSIQEIIRLGIPENITVVHEVDVHLDRGESKKPDVAIISIKHSFGIFESAFHIAEYNGEARLSVLPVHKVVEGES